jgi:hypothetical protein
LDGVDWADSTITLDSTSDLNFYLDGVVGNLMVTGSVPALFQILGSGRAASTLQKVVFAIDGVGSHYDVQIQHVSFIDCELQFLGPGSVHVTLQDVGATVPTATSPFLTVLPNGPSQIEVSDSTIDAVRAYYVFETSILGGISFISSRVNGTQVISASNRLEGSISCFQSELGAASYLVSAATVDQLAFLNFDNCFVKSLNVNSRASLIPTTLNSTLRDVRLENMGLTSTAALQLHNVVGSSDTVIFTRPDVANGDPEPEWHRVSLVYPGNFQIEAPSGLLENVSYSYGNTAVQSTDESFIIGCNFTSTSGSSIVTDALWVGRGANVVLDHLTLMKALFPIEPFTCTNSLTSSWLIAKPGADWRFGSFYVTGVSLDLSASQTFVYQVTLPSDGISTNLQVLLPPRILIEWNLELLGNPDPQTFYPIFKSATAMSTPSIPSPLPNYDISISNTEVEGRFILAFQLTPHPVPVSDSNCPQPIPAGFTCVNGQLVSIGNVEEPTVTIPPNSGTVQVNGNLTSETVVFDGIGSTLNISGCATIPGGIVIELKGNEQNLPNGPIVLVIQNGDCSGSLLDVPVRIEQTKSCKKTKVSQDSTATKSSLAVLFNVDSRSCNTRWIILGSVLGGLAAITAIVAVVGKIMYDKKMKRGVPRPVTSY